MSLLQIENLTVGYSMQNSIRKVLKSIYLNMKEKEIFGIVGESGSGKTTLGLSIINLLARNALVETGRIDFKESNLLALKEKDMVSVRGSQISMIFQDPLNALNPVYTAGFQVKEAIKTHLKINSKKELEKRMLFAFEQVRLKNPENVAYSYPHQLSGGMRQRIMIAQAISCNPSLLIADEPTSNLDVTIQKDILDLFKELRDKLNLTILLISHDLDLVNYVCDEVAVLNKGKIEETGGSQDIFEHPQAEYTKELIKSNEFFKI